MTLSCRLGLSGHINGDDAIRTRIIQIWRINTEKTCVNLLNPCNLCSKNKLLIINTLYKHVISNPSKDAVGFHEK